MCILSNKVFQGIELFLLFSGGKIRRVILNGTDESLYLKLIGDLMKFVCKVMFQNLIVGFKTLKR